MPIPTVRPTTTPSSVERMRRRVGSKLLILPWTSAAQAGGANTATNAIANRTNMLLILLV